MKKKFVFEGTEADSIEVQVPLEGLFGLLGRVCNTSETGNEVRFSLLLW